MFLKTLKKTKWMMIKITTFLSYCPKTMYFNLRVFPLYTALRFPVFIHFRVKLLKVQRGTVIIKKNPVKFGIIKIGGLIGTCVTSGSNISYWSVREGNSVVFNGAAVFCRGNSISVKNGGTLSFGENFWANAFCGFFCEKNITFGDDCLLGWNVLTNDGDGHSIFDKNDLIINPPRDITIGNHVWLCADVRLFKGTTIQDGAIVGTRSSLFSASVKKDSIFAGSPGQTIRENISWRL